jgi:hypothetical protein
MPRGIRNSMQVDTEEVVRVNATHLTRTIQASAEMGFARVDDFDEGTGAGEAKIPGLPERDSDGQPFIRYYVAKDEFHKSKAAVPPEGMSRPMVTPVTRTNAPNIAPTMFNIDGYIQIGDSILCLCREDVHVKYKRDQKRLAEQRLRSIAGERKGDEGQSGTHGELIGGLKQLRNVSKLEDATQVV